MTNDRVKEMAYIALYAALCMVLQIVSDLIPFLQMPQGGSIELGFAALFVAAYHLGWKDGLIVGALWWVIGLLFGKNAWYLNPLQYAFDYLLPIAAVGDISYDVNDPLLRSIMQWYDDAFAADLK